MNPVIHAQSVEALSEAFSRGTQGLLISGPVGIGLSTIAMHFARRTEKVIIPVLPEKDDKIDIGKGSITVEAIRRLYTQTNLRQPKGRIVIIDYAERMKPPAQNAFLKLLEEPSADTQFVLLSHTPTSLLPTILSRVQHLALLPVTREASNELLDTLHVTDATRRTQLLFIAQGLPAELTRLVDDETQFEKRAAIVRDARSFTQGSPYEKLKLAVQYKDSRETALILLDDAAKMIRSTLKKGENTQHWLGLLQSIERAHTRITEQGNVRLQLSTIGMV